jgi:hypothetical protein
MTTHYTNQIQLTRTPRETVFEFTHAGLEPDSKPIRIAMTHETFSELKELINREPESENLQSE